jgi:hypothetical protein
MEKVYEISEVNRPLVELIAYFPALSLLLLMFVLPAAYQEIKATFLAVIILQILLISFTTGHFNLHPIIFILFIFYLLIGSIYSLYGVFRGNLGVIPVTKEIVFYVFIYMFLIAGIRSNYCIKLIHNTLCLATLILIIYLFYTVLYYIGLLPIWLYVDLYENTTGIQEVGLAVLETRGSIGIDISSLPSLLFLQPYLITHEIIEQKRPSIFKLILILLATFTMLISGKRIMQIIGLSSPLLISCFLLIFDRSLLKRITLFILIFTLTNLIFFAVLYEFGFDFNLIANYIIEGFSSSVATEGNVRIEQFHALFNGWIKSPVFGSGSGAVLSEYIRSIEEPWNYELSYMKLLYDFGLIGFALYGIGVLFTWNTLIWIYLRNNVLGKYALPVAIGSLSFMAGNATNPFLLKFDYLVTIFLPIALVNLWLMNKRIST